MHFRLNLNDTCKSCNPIITHTQYYKRVNPKTQFKGIKVIDQSFL